MFKNSLFLLYRVLPSEHPVDGQLTYSGTAWTGYLTLKHFTYIWWMIKWNNRKRDTRHAKSGENCST